MSQENVELVRAMLNAWIEVDEGLADPELLTEFISPDGTVDTTTFSGFPGPREFHSMDEFLEFRTAWMEPYDEWSYEAQKILDAGGNRVVATFHQRGKLRDSGSWVEMHYGFVYTVEEGLIMRTEMYATPKEALEAAGLRE